MVLLQRGDDMEKVDYNMMLQAPKEKLLELERFNRQASKEDIEALQKKQMEYMRNVTTN